MNEEKSTAMEALRSESPPHKWLYDFNADATVHIRPTARTNRFRWLPTRQKSSSRCMVEVLLSAGHGQTVSECRLTVGQSSIQRALR